MLGECVQPHVPVNQNAVVDVGDLRIQRNLRSLRDDPAETAEGVGDPFGKQRLAADAETGGKHHRRRLQAAVQARQIAHHAHAGVIRMFDKLCQLCHQAPAESAQVFRRVQLHAEQHQVREIADKTMRVLPFAFAVEQRHVEPEARHIPTLADGQCEQR